MLPSLQPNTQTNSKTCYLQESDLYAKQIDCNKAATSAKDFGYTPGNRFQHIEDAYCKTLAVIE